METVYIFAISTGFLGGFGHCMGMCGPIVASFSVYDSATTRGRRFANHLLYNSGRTLTYSFTGAAMGLSGSVIGSMPSLGDAVAVAAGLFMVITGLGITGVFSRLKSIEGRSTLILKLARELSVSSTPWRYLLLGSLFGFLPCGLSYSVFAAAAATGSILKGMLSGFLFGLGTVPALVVFGMAASLISSKLRGALYRTAGIVIVVMGIFYILRAMGYHAKM
jgi:hypothetical protein